MQIRPITVNAVTTTVAQNVERNGTPAQTGNNMFTPQCKVTISREGKRLSRQQAEQPQGNAQDVAVKRMMLRWNEESEQSEKITDGYREQLQDIEKYISSLNSSFKTEADGETIEKEQEVLRALREQKQAQLEENQRRAQEARELAETYSAKYQEEIDGNNRKLWTLLKTLEEAEKAEEEREGGAKEGDSASDTPEAGNSVSDTIQNLATQFATASMGRDLYVDGKLEGLSVEGHQLVDFANTITSTILEESEKVRAALDDEKYTDDMLAELMDHFQEQAALSYDQVEKNRSYGLHILQEVRDYKIKRIADNPLAGLQETKDSMMMSAADAVLGEARQNRLEETSKELEDEVQKLIEKRNSVDRTQVEKEEDEEEEEEEKVEDSKELTDTETEKEEDEQAGYWVN